MGDVTWKMIWGCDLVFFPDVGGCDLEFGMFSGIFLVILEGANCTISRDLMMDVNNGLDP